MLFFDSSNKYNKFGGESNYCLIVSKLLYECKQFLVIIFI